MQKRILSASLGPYQEKEYPTPPICEIIQMFTWTAIITLYSSVWCNWRARNQGVKIEQIRSIVAFMHEKPLGYIYRSYGIPSEGISSTQQPALEMPQVRTASLYQCHSKDPANHASSEIWTALNAITAFLTSSSATPCHFSLSA